MKVQTAFRLDKELIDILKKRAKLQKRSLNNYVEFLLYNFVESTTSANHETQNVIEDSESGYGLAEIDDLEAYKNAIEEGLASGVSSKTIPDIMQEVVDKMKANGQL